MASTPSSAPDLLQIEALTDRDDLLKVGIYSESGVGKTVFASTFPRPILWLEAEGGTNSIADKKDIDIARMSGLDSYREALRYLQANPGKYKTVVIDSGSEAQAAVLSEVMRAEAADDADIDEFAPHLQHFGKVARVMREVLRGFRDLPMNVVITALTREDEDALGKKKVRPKFLPAVAEDFPSFLDAVVFLYPVPEKDEEGKPIEGGEVTRRGLLAPTGKYAAKVRAPMGTKPPTYIDNPTHKDIDAIVFPKKTAAKAAK